MHFFLEDVVKPSAGDWVAAVYNGKWYLGKVLQDDLQDGDAYITFMQASGKCEDTFKLPSRPDKIWMKFSSILAIIEPPSPHSKTSRQYKVNMETVQMITHLHTKWIEKNNSKE